MAEQKGVGERLREKGPFWGSQMKGIEGFEERD